MCYQCIDLLVQRGLSSASYRVGCMSLAVEVVGFQAHQGMNMLTNDASSEVVAWYKGKTFCYISLRSCVRKQQFAS